MVTLEAGILELFGIAIWAPAAVDDLRSAASAILWRQAHSSLIGARLAWMPGRLPLNWICERLKRLIVSSFEALTMKSMKTKMTRQASTELPRLIVGALATAGASVANGATVQITFANNVVSSATGTTNFVADLTGDGVVDVMGSYVASAAAGLRTAPGQHLGVARKIDGGTSNVLSLDGVGSVSNTLDRPLSLRGSFLLCLLRGGSGWRRFMGGWT